jgi:NDP-mannose synthase
MHAIILAGGKGTRLAPYTTVFPKPLMPVRGMPILEIIVRQLAHYGYNELTFCVAHMAQLIRTYFGDGSALGVSIDYSYEHEPLGTAGPLALPPWPVEPMLVMNADVLCSIDFAAMYRCHVRNNALITLGLFPKRTKIDLGVLQTEGEEIVQYIEKPEFLHWVSMGVYIVSPRARSYIPSGVKFDFPDLVAAALQAGERVRAYRFEGQWLDIGRPSDYELACSEFDRHYTAFLPQPAELVLGQELLFAAASD